MTNIETLKKLSDITSKKAWAVFVYSEKAKNGRWRKPPINPLTGKLAKPNDRETCVSFDEAVMHLKGKDFLNRKYQGLSFMPGDGILGIDLDDCIANGEVAPYADEIINILNSYTEISPSGTGIRIIGKCSMVENHKKDKPVSVEMYYKNHFLTMTGNVYKKFRPIRDITTEAIELVEKYFPPTPKLERQSISNFATTNLSDNEIIHKIVSESNSKGKDLFYNNTLLATESENDLALCNKIAFYTQDPMQVRRVFEKSTLYQLKDKSHRKRFDGRYGDLTIEKAISSLLNAYDNKTFMPKDLINTNRKTNGSIYINKIDNGSIVMVIYNNGKKVFDRRSALVDESSFKHVQHLLSIYTQYKEFKGEIVEGYFKLISNLKISKSEYEELKKQFCFIATSNLVFNSLGR